MIESIRMPKWGYAMDDGTIAKWLKQEGDRVTKDEPIVVVDTDKVSNEVLSPVNGTMARIFVKEGETAPVGSIVAEILPSDE